MFLWVNNWFILRALDVEGVVVGPHLGISSENRALVVGVSGCRSMGVHLSRVIPVIKRAVCLVFEMNLSKRVLDSAHLLIFNPLFLHISWSQNLIAQLLLIIISFGPFIRAPGGNEMLSALHRRLKSRVKRWVVPKVNWGNVQRSGLGNISQTFIWIKDRSLDFVMVLSWFEMVNQIPMVQIVVITCCLCSAVVRSRQFWDASSLLWHDIVLDIRNALRLVVRNFSLLKLVFPGFNVLYRLDLRAV